VRAGLVVVASLAAIVAAGCPSPGEKPAAASTAAVAPRQGNGRNVLLVTIDTVRADHVGAYGYQRKTTPNIDALAARGALFTEAYTYWPKTRGSFVALLTGRRAAQTGYGKVRPELLDFNHTLASVLQAAGYRTAAVVDNPNVAAALGYSKGFDTYRETFQERGLTDEVAKTRAITEGAEAFLRQAPKDRPFFLWLHYVCPHAPYAPPPPYDTAFLDAASKGGPVLPVVDGLHGGIPKQWAVPGKTQLGWYVAQYDGEIAFADAEVGKVLAALRASSYEANTIVMVASDHGESLGEHGYYFDHGEDLFDPCLRIPLVMRAPEGTEGVRPGMLVSTLDIVPTLLDAVKVSWPPDLAGESLLPAVQGRLKPDRPRLVGQNDRSLTALWDAQWKLVATPDGDGARMALYDRAADPKETKDVALARSPERRRLVRELELFQETSDGERSRAARLLLGVKPVEKLSPEACERLKALGYPGQGCE